MPSKAFDTIVGLVPSLDRAEISALIGRLTALRQVGGGTAVTTTSTEVTGAAQIVAMINRVLAANDIPSNPTIVRFVDHQRELELKGVAKFIEDAHPERHGQLAILELGLRLLYDDMTEGGIPVTGKTMIQQAYRLPAVLNKHFPSYAKNKLFGFVVDRRRK